MAEVNDLDMASQVDEYDVSNGGIMPPASVMNQLATVTEFGKILSFMKLGIVPGPGVSSRTSLCLVYCTRSSAETAQAEGVFKLAIVFWFLVLSEHNLQDIYTTRRQLDLHFLESNDHALEQRKISNELTSTVVDMLLNFCTHSESLLSLVTRVVINTANLLYVLVRAERFLSYGVTKKLH